MSTSTSSFLIDTISEIAFEAGKEIMNIYRDEKLFTSVNFTKEDNSPLTLADMRSNEIIIDRLKKIDPSIPIISEENKQIPYEERKNWKKFWLVDPLDGTKEFIKRSNEFTVNIALIEDRVSVLGVIYAPAIDILYAGGINEGAYKIHDNIRTEIRTNKGNKSLVAVGSVSHSSPEEEEKILKQYSIKKFVSAGSSLKFCMVAAGAADIYYRHGPTMEWDIAAGQAIVESSGGVVQNMKKESFHYNKQILKNDSFICVGDPSLL